MIVYMPEDHCIQAADKVHGLIDKYDGRIKAVAVRRGLSMLAVKGFGLEESPGIITGISRPLSEKSINIHGIYTVSSTIFVLVDWKVREMALSMLKEAFSCKR